MVTTELLIFCLNTDTTDGRVNATHHGDYTSKGYGPNHLVLLENGFVESALIGKVMPVSTSSVSFPVLFLSVLQTYAGCSCEWQGLLNR